MRLGEGFMRLKSFTALSLALLILSAAPALAEEIIYFTNGKTMAIRGHNVEDGMIHVDLGNDGFIAFPESKVERIVEAGQNVYLAPSYSKANVSNGRYDGDIKVKPAAPVRFPVNGGSSVSSKFDSKKGLTVQQAPGSNWQELNPVQRGLHDIHTMYPMANSVNAAARRMGVVGRTSIRQGPNQGGLIGAEGYGGKQIINVKTSHNKNPNRHGVMRIGVRPSIPVNRRGQGAATAPPGGSGSSGNAGSAGSTQGGN
jgi:hypothetical protein